jgi:hypothetical protein
MIDTLRDELILKHAAFANNTARKILVSGLRSEHQEDARQEALLALCKAVDSFQADKRESGGLTEYISCKMYYAVKDYTRKLPLVGTARKTRRTDLQRVYRVLVKGDYGDMLLVHPFTTLTVDPDYTLWVSWALSKAALQYSQRDIDIFREWCEDAGTGHIAKRYSVSRTRVKQIVKDITEYLRMIVLGTFLG